VDLRKLSSGNEEAIFAAFRTKLFVVLVRAK
jgi:hypothetical protein